MDIVFFLSSVNKLALLAFLITFCFILFEFYQLTHRHKSTDKPVIPDFNSKKVYRPVAVAKHSVEEPTKKKTLTKPNKTVFFIFGAIILILIAGIGTTFYMNSSNVVPSQKTTHTSIAPSPDGIHVYDTQWQEITRNDPKRIVAGNTIYIGVENVPNAFINKARIRINQRVWTKKDETTLIKKSENVFYRAYEIASNEAQLHIEAQLHTEKDGWLDN